MSKNGKTTGSPVATLVPTTPDLVEPQRGDARVAKALINILGRLPPGNLDLTKTTQFTFPKVGFTPMDVSLGECCGSKNYPVIKQTSMRRIRYGKGIRALRFTRPRSYRPLDLQEVPRSFDIRNVQIFCTFLKCEDMKLHIFTFSEMCRISAHF